MINYYSTALQRVELFGVEDENQHMLSEAKIKYKILFSEEELNVPQFIYFFLIAIGNVKDKTGRELY